MVEMTPLRAQVAQNNATSVVGSNAMRSATGLATQSARPASIASKLADAQEEIGNSLTTRLRSKADLDQKQVRRGQGISEEALKRIAEARERLPDMPQGPELKQLIQRMEEFRERLEQGGEKISSEEKRNFILNALNNFDPDVTHQDEGLKFVKKHFETSTGNHSKATSLLLEGLDGVEEYFQQTGIQQDILAGRAAAKLAHTAADEVGKSPMEIREQYRLMLREEMNCGDLLGRLAEYDKKGKLDTVIDLFLSIAGQDLSGTVSSTDPGFLHALLTELSKLKSFKTILDVCGNLINSLKIETLDKVELGKRLLDFASKANASTSDTTAVFKGLEEADPGVVVTFSIGVQNIHRDMPDTVVPSNSARLQQNTMLETIISSFTDNEEEYHATFN